MTNKLGSLICWILYLTLVRWVARPLVPLIIGLLGLTLVAYLLLPFLMPESFFRDRDEEP